MSAELWCLGQAQAGTSGEVCPPMGAEPPAATSVCQPQLAASGRVRCVWWSVIQASLVRLRTFYKVRVCGGPALSKLAGATLPTALVHLVSPRHSRSF